MAEILIDDDWKRQAQEEKRKLAEEERARAEQARPAATTTSTSGTTAAAAQRDVPEPSFEGIVQHLATQALYYMGELSQESERPSVDLDMARYHIELLAVLDARTGGKLSVPEQQALDMTLYDLRMRYVSISTQMIR